MAEELVLKGTVCAPTDMVTNMIVTSLPNKSIPIETTTKISDLPVNLVEEILSRVPLKYMRAVRLTCKEWDTLSKSPIFSKMHADKIRSDESMMMIAMIDYNLYLMRVVFFVNEDPHLERKGKLTCQDIQSKISQVFHCDGLLLCVLEEDATKVIVWNPYWGQTRSIDCRYSHRPYRWDRFTYALGYEDKGSCRSYKFLRFIDKYYNAPIDQFLWYEIYDFENTNDVLDDHIICFDYTKEKLAVLLTHNEAGPMEFDIWITTKIEADKEKKVAMGYHNTFNIVGEVGYLKKLELVERAGTDVGYCKSNGCSYVPSLVQIKQSAAGGGGERKRQSDLEKQRYDQNMSRLATIENRSSV
ncbi:BnaA09g27180D [Brassica napus]|uniref:BnaA09g27180D protein n=1 Tax=Brassica napus TaxID=3708 RepID=A0A078H921_BRANA|nr:BnaA09g27180D [Brassica napus]